MATPFTNLLTALEEFRHILHARWPVESAGKCSDLVTVCFVSTHALQSRIAGLAGECGYAKPPCVWGGNAAWFTLYGPSGTFRGNVPVAVESAAITVAVRQTVEAWLESWLSAARTQLVANTPALQPAPRRTTRRRYRRDVGESPELTAKQVEAFTLFGEHRGNRSKVAAAMGISRAAAEKHIRAAEKKLGRLGTRFTAKTVALPQDSRGQATVERDRRRP